MEYSREDRLKFAKHFERAQGWLLLDRPDAAELALEEIPAVFQARPVVRLFRSHLYMSTREWGRAEPLLRQLLDADPDEPEYWISLAYVVRRAHSLAEAEPILLEARRRFADVPLIWFNLACYATQQGRLVDAHALLLEAFRLAPQLQDQAKADPDLAPYWAWRGPGKA